MATKYTNALSDEVPGLATASWVFQFDVSTPGAEAAAGINQVEVVVLPAGFLPVRKSAPESSGSSQSESRVSGVPSPVNCRWRRPYQSEKLVQGTVPPPVRVPTQRPLCSSKRQEPEEPNSVVPRSQPATRRNLPSPGEMVPPREVTVAGSVSKLMDFSSAFGWWMHTDA